VINFCFVCARTTAADQLVTDQSSEMNGKETGDTRPAETSSPVGFFRMVRMLRWPRAGGKTTEGLAVGKFKGQFQSPPSRIFSVMIVSVGCFRP
jgi:hypothetical protein